MRHSELQHDSQLLTVPIEQHLSKSVYTSSWVAVWSFWGRQWLPLSASSQVSHTSILAPTNALQLITSRSVQHSPTRARERASPTRRNRPGIRKATSERAPTTRARGSRGRKRYCNQPGNGERLPRCWQAAQARWRICVGNQEGYLWIRERQREEVNIGVSRERMEGHRTTRDLRSERFEPESVEP